MSDLKNPFGLRNGSIIMIEDIPPTERGLRCNCVCPACGDSFEARLGSVRVHHFAHSGEGCDEEVAALTGLYMLVREYILSNTFHLPALTLFWSNYDTPFTEENFDNRVHYSKTHKNEQAIVVIPPKVVRFEEASIKTQGNRPTAIILTFHSHQMALCITPPSTVCKKRWPLKPFQNLATIQFDASRIPFSQKQKNQLMKLIADQMKLCKWVYSPKANQAIDKINDLNQSWLREKQERERIAIRRQKDKRRFQEQRRYEQKKTVNPTLNGLPRWDGSSDLRNKTRVEQGLTAEQKRMAGYNEVKNRFTQQDEQIRDSFGTRWIKCRICGEIKPAQEFSDYGGKNSINSGTCSSCRRKSVSN